MWVRFRNAVGTVICLSTRVVMVTTFVAPPLLKALSPAIPPGYIPVEPEGIDMLATDE